MPEVSHEFLGMISELLVICDTMFEMDSDDISEGQQNALDLVENIRKELNMLYVDPNQS